MYGLQTIVLGRLFKRCHILSQQFAQKRENVETDINEGFKVIYRVNSGLKGDIKVIEKMKIF